MIFIRNVYEDGKVVTRFVMAKTKVAPSKTHLSGEVGTASGTAGSPSGQSCSRGSHQTGPSAIFLDVQLERSELDQVDCRLLQALRQPPNRGNPAINGAAGMAIHPRSEKC